jgi:pentatricopeptide repeat protein
MACDGDVAVGTSLVTTYARHLLPGHARSAFEQILHPNAHSWSALISALAAPGGHHAELADSMLARMREQGSIPNKVSFLSLLRVCDRDRHCDRPPRCYVTAAHLAILANGFESDPVVATSLIDAKSRCGKLGEVRAIFDGICCLDEQAWNAVISAHTLHHRTREASQLYNQMLQQGSMPNGFIVASIVSACASPDRRCDGKRIHALCIASEFEEDDVVQNALLNMYGKSGDLELARCMFEQVRKPDKYLWTSMIVMLCENDEGQEALRVFARLQGHVKPDNVTFSSVLSACANEAMLNQGKVIHARIMEEEAKVVLAVGNALLNMYSKCGSLQDAENVFLGMGSKDTVSWNAMITAYSHHGHFKASIDLFDVMKEEGLCSPNEVTFVAILSACSHGGMVDKGSCYFTSMTKDHGMEPLEEHYNCMIDLFARAGLLDDAENLISKMPMEASAVSWLTLLSACKCEADLGRGIAYANKLFQLESDSSAPYFMLADLHYRIGMEDEAVKVLHALNTKDSKEALVDW